MAAYTDETHYDFTMDPKNRLVQEHIQAGGLAVVLEEGIRGQMITLYDEGKHLPLLWTFLIPATMEGKAMHNVSNAMSAALAAYASGVSLENIRQGLRTFDTSFFQVPGRMNVFDEHPFKVILDYAHNPAAVQCMVQFTSRLDVSGRRIAVVSAPGDRRDEDIAEIASLIAQGQFNHVIVRRDDSPRGRGEDEVPRLLKDGLLAAGMAEENITVIIDEVEAVQCALERAQTNDLVMIFGDAITRCGKQIVTFKSSEAPTDTPAADTPSLELPPLETHGLTMEQFESIVIDERGARLAREEND